MGYKVQVAETVASPEGKSSFITSVVTQRAAESDEAGLTATLQKQERLGLEKPTEMYVDGAYVSAEAIHEAKEAGWQLMGPAQPSAARPGLKKEYRIEAFDINISERKALCPAGNQSAFCSKLLSKKAAKSPTVLSLAAIVMTVRIGLPACRALKLIAPSLWEPITKYSSKDAVSNRAQNFSF